MAPIWFTLIIQHRVTIPIRPKGQVKAFVTIAFHRLR